jgi:evolutionarily conserved signaling intermediate in Toll pathway
MWGGLRLLRSFAAWGRPAVRAFGVEPSASELVPHDSFARSEVKDRDAYLAMIEAFENRDARRRGHVEFIYAGLRRMEEFGVHRDKEVYRALLGVLPKGRFVATNLLQAEYMHFPKQQDCAINLLDQMEEFGVMPDFEFEDALVAIFGKRSYPLRKLRRMMYWMPKFKNLNPWRRPHEMPDDASRLAILAIRQITSVDDDMEIVRFEVNFAIP